MCKMKDVNKNWTEAVKNAAIIFYYTVFISLFVVNKIAKL
jgi:hypothetical protein